MVSAGSAVSKKSLDIGVPYRLAFKYNVKPRQIETERGLRPGGKLVLIYG